MTLTDDRTITTINPTDGSVLATYPLVSNDEAEAMLQRAHDAFQSWRRTPLQERIALFHRMADAIEARADDFARISSEEMGRPLRQSYGEAAAVPRIFRYYADRAPELLAPRPIDVPGFSRAEIVPEAVGVVLAIEPWNSPLVQAMRAAAPNLMLGNTVILKPSAVTPASTFLFDELFHEVGFPDGVYTTALISVDQAGAVIDDPRTRAVTLTGSNAAGASVGARVGRVAKPVVLELGGSDPFIVLPSADVERAAAMAATCRLVLGGQACISPKRIIVTEEVADDFIGRFVQQFANQKVGDPFDPETTVGPMATARGADDLQALYQDAVDKGATVLVPGGRIEGPGAYFQPAAITDITPEMRVYSEEAFGPLAMIFRVPDTAAAVALANDTEFGLGGSVFGSDEEAFDVARVVDSGVLAINGWMGGPVEVPFGGTKASGHGRELGPSGMEQFANVKTYAFA